MNYYIYKLNKKILVIKIKKNITKKNNSYIAIIVYQY